MCPKCRSQIDIFFHMTNHYRKLRNVKAIVDSSAPKKYNKTTTNRENSGKISKRIRSATSLTSKTERHTNTSRQKLSTTSQTIEEVCETENNTSCTKATGTDVGKRTTETETTPENYRLQTIPPPNSQLYSDTNNKIQDHEYNHFLLRILEDILRNTLNDGEIDKIIKSHIQANKERLNEERMVQTTEELKKRIKFKRIGNSESAGQIELSDSSTISTTTSDADTEKEHTGSESVSLSDRSETDSSVLNKRIVTSTATKKYENIETFIKKNDKIMLHESPVVQTLPNYSHPFYCKKLVLKLQLDDRNVDDGDYVIVDGPLYLPKSLLENQCKPILLESSSTSLQKDIEMHKEIESEPIVSYHRDENLPNAVNEPIASYHHDENLPNAVNEPIVSYHHDENLPNAVNEPIVSYHHDENLPNAVLTQKLIDDDYDLTPEKEIQQQSSSDKQIFDYQTDEPPKNDDDFQRIYKLLYQDAATNVTSRSLLSLTEDQSTNFSEIFTQIFIDDDFEKQKTLIKGNKQLTPHLYETEKSPLEVRLFDGKNQSSDDSSEVVETEEDLDEDAESKATKSCSLKR